MQRKRWSHEIIDFLGWFEKDAHQVKPVKEYDIFVPLYYNDGVPIEPRNANQFLSMFKKRLKQELGQEEILLIVRDFETLSASNDAVRTTIGNWRYQQ